MRQICIASYFIDDMTFLFFDKGKNMIQELFLYRVNPQLKVN